ncbi:alpha/beta hydrolase fold protein [Burkholderia paludis]|uniref:Alpha/beta hydrolase fold protein n=3 Tax=Burkholderia paludis TaxID=1506587 RepID=A0A6J5DI49_9BURK|nr:alpha/beta fold hydrolase [Burkholderia sp. MSh2]CAB3753127.1 Thermostable monoacylglycerol lipase [Burkholderia paludis]VWB65648.1 alpha/beta hydrolase fold protein [Burkholderia paludis]
MGIEESGKLMAQGVAIAIAAIVYGVKNRAGEWKRSTEIMESEIYRDNGQPFLLEGNEIGVLLSHGYTGTTSGMRFLGEYLHEKEGWTVHAPRLQGHGDSPAAMAESTATDWIRSLEEGLDLLSQRCSTVFMAGLSMGGCLTMYMAAQYADVIKAAVPINACLYFGTSALAELAYKKDAPAYLVGVGNDVKDPDVTEVAYREIPVATIKEIYGLMNVTRDLLPNVVCPTLVMVSPDDHVVPPASSHAILDGIGSVDRRLLVLGNSYHVATIDFDKETIAERTRAFFNEQLGASRGGGPA